MKDEDTAKNEPIELYISDARKFVKENYNFDDESAQFSYAVRLETESKRYTLDDLAEFLPPEKIEELMKRGVIRFGEYENDEYDDEEFLIDSFENFCYFISLIKPQLNVDIHITKTREGILDKLKEDHNITVRFYEIFKGGP